MASPMRSCDGGRPTSDTLERREFGQPCFLNIDTKRLFYERNNPEYLGLISFIR
jgi:hypothetical protein